MRLFGANRTLGLAVDHLLWDIFSAFVSPYSEQNATGTNRGVPPQAT